MKQFSLFIHLMLSVLLFSSCGGKSKTASVIEAEKAIPLRYAETSACLQPRTIPLPVCAIHGIRPGYCIPTSWLTKKSPYCRLARRDACPHAIEQGRCLLIRTLRIAKPDWCFEKYWRSLRFEVYQTARSAGWLPHRKHHRCREWNQPGYRKDNRPAPRCHYALPFRVQWRIRTGGETRTSPLSNVRTTWKLSALGRAEWMRFYGLLFGQAQKADSLFAEVEKNYNELKALVAPLFICAERYQRTEERFGLVCSGREKHLRADLCGCRGQLCVCR